MPILSDPEVQAFISQQTGFNPAATMAKLIPVMPGTQGVEAPPIGSSPITYQLGQNASDMMQNTTALKPLVNYLSNLGVDHGSSAMATALALGLGGAGFGLLTHRSPVMTGLIGAGLGAGLGYGASHLTSALNDNRKMRQIDNLSILEDRSAGPRHDAALSKLASAYYGMAEDPMQFIQSKVFADNGMDGGSKADILSQLMQLPQNQLMTLAGMLRTAAGSAAGYIIARFLLNMGGVGQALGAGIGGLMGLSAGGSMPRNAYGDSINNQYDVFGQRRIVS